MEKLRTDYDFVVECGDGSIIMYGLLLDTHQAVVTKDDFDDYGNVIKRKGNVSCFFEIFDAIIDDVVIPAKMKIPVRTETDIHELDVYLPDDCTYLFSFSAYQEQMERHFEDDEDYEVFEKTKNIKTIKFEKGLNTSFVTNTSHMFDGCVHLELLDLSSFNTHNVTEMDFMFFGCKKLKTVDLSNFDISNVKSKKYMFSGCHQLKTIYVSSDEVKDFIEKSLEESGVKGDEVVIIVQQPDIKGKVNKNKLDTQDKFSFNSVGF